MVPTAGVFRWSFRWLPLFHLVLALCTAEALTSFSQKQRRFAAFLLLAIGAFAQETTAAIQEHRKVDGRNVLDVWRGSAKSPERTLFWEWRAEDYNQLAAMRGNLKLVITADTPPELYDVVADPAEMRSVHAEHPQLMKDLQAEIKAWIATESAASKDQGTAAAQ